MGPKILLVDDSDTVLMSEKMMLTGQGYQLELARNGQEALTKVAAGRPDLILLDIMMPKVDGIETCRRLKNDPDTKEIPIVMVTTRGEAEKVEEAFRAGCDDYVTKPFNRLDLLTKIKSHLG